jgi:predicted acylesterase/phospholipase RssA
MSRQNSQRVSNIAFVLSGGASVGALQVGMLRAASSSDDALISLPAPDPTQV